MNKTESKIIQKNTNILSISTKLYKFVIGMEDV